MGCPQGGLVCDDEADVKHCGIAGAGGVFAVHQDQVERTFAFEYVPQDKYILKISGAGDAQQKASQSPADNSNAAPNAPPEVHYADKEIPLTVLEDMSSVAIALTPATPAKPAAQ